MPLPQSSYRGGYGPAWARGERRAGVRRPSGRPIACHPTACQTGEDWWEEAVIREVSRTGLSLALGRRLEPGSVVMLGSDAGPRFLAARVVHAAPSGAYWLVGCKLLTALSEAELNTWW